jgi:hypothetical protein
LFAHFLEKNARGIAREHLSDHYQHAGGESMHAGVAVAALMLCLELLACIDRGMAKAESAAPAPP